MVKDVIYVFTFCDTGRRVIWRCCRFGSPRTRPLPRLAA